jgi:hypothetical protein
MKSGALLLIIILVSCAGQRKLYKLYDSTYIKRDSLNIKVTRDTINGKTDTVRYYVAQVSVSRSRQWFYARQGFWYAVGAVFIIIAYLFLKR